MRERATVPIYRPFKLNLAQVLMNELHCDRPFTYSGGHSFDRAVPHVAYGENTGNVGLEQERSPFQRPSLGPLALPYQVGTGQYEAPFVAFHNICKPLRSGQRSDKDEHRSCPHPLNLIRVGAEKRNLFQMGFTVNFGHTRVWPNLDLGRPLDLIDQIL